MTRPSDRDPVETLEEELDEFEDPLEPRSDASLPARRSNRPALSHSTYSAVFGNCERTGTWSAPDRLSVESWFGDVTLDFRDAEIAADGVVEVRANAIFGQVTLKVPRGTEIEMDGVSALFGGVGSKQTEKKLGDLARKWLTGERPEDEYEEFDDEDPDEEPMLLRVIGNAIFGQITVEVG
jgi:hypothetical protein